jgi:hypothetical protein
MFKQTLLASGLALLSTAALAGAGASPAETRGYENCRSKAEDRDRSLAVDKTYFINQQGYSRIYYLNGVAVENGVSTPVRIACTTSNSGNRTLTMNLESGRYVGKLAAAVDIAKN